MNTFTYQKILRDEKLAPYLAQYLNNNMLKENVASDIYNEFLNNENKAEFLNDENNRNKIDTLILYTLLSLSIERIQQLIKN